MRPEQEASYRLNLARGYLAEAEEDIKRKRWRSCAAGAQLSIEAETMPGEVAAKAREIIPIVAKFGGKEHGLFSYGDTKRFRDPWSLVTKAKANEGLNGARRCLTTAEEVYEHFFSLEF